MAKPGVILPPKSREQLQRGVDTMVNLLRVTLGPKARTVVIAPVVASSSPPEVLNDGATIARRVTDLPGQVENCGAMLVRQLAWRVREDVGDGSTTAAVIAQSLLAESNRYIASGGNVMMIKQGIEQGLQLVLAELERQSASVDDPDQMGALIANATNDEEIGKIFGEIFDIIGRDGVVIVQDSQTTHMSRDYIEGVQYENGYLSPYMVTDTDRMHVVLDDTLVLLTNRTVNKAGQLLPALDKARKAGFNNLLVVANDLTGDALALLVVNKQQGVMNALGVKAPGFGDRRMAILQDLAVITGGRVINEDAGDVLEDVEIGDFGRAQRVWADSSAFNVIGGYGDPAAVRERAANLKKEIPTIKEDFEREKARERLGKLLGGICVVSVGAPTTSAQKEKRNRTDNAVCVMRQAGESGVVPGGGAALLTCARILRRQEASGSNATEIAMGYRTLATALEAPTSWIVANGGYKAAPVIAELALRPDGWGFDVMKAEFRDMIEAGILDPTEVLRTALKTGVSGALMAMTTDVLVLHKKPDWTAEP